MSSPYAAQVDFSAIMPTCAIVALTPFYGYFLKLASMQIDWSYQGTNSWPIFG